MKTLSISIGEDKKPTVVTPQPLVEGENLTTEIAVTPPESWAGYEIRCLLTTPKGVLVDAVDASEPVGLTNTMLDGKGTLYAEFAAMKGGTEIARTVSPALLPVSAARSMIGEIDPAPLPDLVAEMVDAKNGANTAAQTANDAATSCTEAEQATKDAEAARVIAEEGRVLQASTDHQTAHGDHEAIAPTITEVADARGAFASLGARINGIDVELGQTISYMPDLYLGQVADRCKLPTTKNVSGGSPAMSRTVHHAREHIVNPKIVIPNYYGTAEAAGSPATVKASIEYPAGTFTRALFSGLESGAMESGGCLITDEIPVTIPYGATFYSRIYIERADGSLLWSNNRDSVPGDGFEYGTGRTDKTMSGSIAQSSSSNFAPIAIIAPTRRPSFLLIGDSRMTGMPYSASGLHQIAGGHKGDVAPSIGQIYAYSDFAFGGESASNFIYHHDKRIELSKYYSHVICNYGINDITTGASADTTLSRLVTIAGYFAKSYYQTTIPPVATSTDNFTTVENQTTHANNAERVALNTSIRSGLVTGSVFHIELADVLEHARNSGLWKPLCTKDGVHVNDYGGYAIIASGAVNPAMFSLG